MKLKTVPSSWLHRESKRLDSRPYSSGALEAKVRLEEMKAKKEPLQSLTLGGIDGIYHAGREGRTWVDSPEHGVPFLGSTKILAADLSNLPLISKRQVKKNSKFTIRAGWTLITRSGTIGRMAYARPDMDGMACSEHVMRVIPDSREAPPGYVYAYLSSKFGVPLVISGTYGSIIQSIEPQHIADLPVPRLGDAVEGRAHELVEEAAAKRAEAAAYRSRALALMEEQLGWTSRRVHTLVTPAKSSLIQRRMDGFHHTRSVIEARQALGSVSGRARLGDVVQEVFEPNRGARMKVEDPRFGVPFLSSSQVFRLDPTGEYLISRRRTPHLERQIVTEQDVLLPRSGQLGGIIGRAVLPLPTYCGDAASEHLVRVRCRTKEDAFYLWAVLASEPGYYAAIGTSFGSSIPSLDCTLIAELNVPWIEGGFRDEVVELVGAKIRDLSSAIEVERSATALIERTIEEAA